MAFLLLTLLPFVCSAKQPGIHDLNFHNYTAKEDFPEETVLTILQDSRGFLWFGTVEGLYRYDGRKCTVFKNDPADSFTISDNLIHSLVEDRNGIIWIGTKNGLNQYSYHTNTFRQILYKPSKGIDLKSADVYSLALDSAGVVWAGTYGGGLFRISGYKPDEKEAPIITHFMYNPDLANSISSNDVFTICFDHLNRGFVGTNHGICVFRPDDSIISFTRLIHTADKNSIAENFINQLYCDSRNLIWAVSRNQLDRINITALNNLEIHVEHFFPGIQHATSDSATSVMNFLVDASGFCWLSIYEIGLIRFRYPEPIQGSLDTNSIEAFNYKPIEGGLTTKHIYTLYQKDARLMWIGTEAGLSKLLCEQELFKRIYFSNSHLKQHSISFNAVFCDTAGNIWFGGTGSGIWLKTRSGEKYIPLRNRQKDLGSNAVACIASSEAGDLLIGTIQGLYIIKAHEVQRLLTTPLTEVNSDYFTPDNSDLPGQHIFCISQQMGENIWIGTNAGLAVYNPVTAQFKKVIAPAKHNYSPAFSFRSFASIGSDTIAVGSEEGLYLCNTKTFGYKRFTVEHHLDHGFSSNQINSLSYDEKNRKLWIGSAEGIWDYNTTSHQFEKIKIQKNLENEAVYKMALDNEANVWFNTKKGLAIWYPKANQMKRLYFSLELFPTDDLYCLLTKDINGNILIINDKGFFSVNPKDVSLNHERQPVTITDFKIYGTSIFFDKLRALGNKFRAENTVTLNPDQKQFTVEFASLDFFSRGNTEYEYKLEGFDNNWVYTTNNSNATYTNLDGGTYTFYVKATNSDGVWDPTGVSFSVVVIPPFYKTVWFYLTVVLTFLLTTGFVFYMIYRIRIARILLAQRIRNRIATDLHDDIGSSLNSISVYSEIVKRSLSQDNVHALSVIEKMGIASRTMIETMNDIVWAIDQKNDDFEQVIQRMKYFAGELLGGKNILLQLDIDDRVRKVRLPMEIRKNFYLIYKEAINNAFKYSDARNVNVSLSLENSELAMIITDDGKGFEPKEKGLGGNGLKNMEVRAKEIGAYLTISSWIGKGSRISLIIPRVKEF